MIVFVKYKNELKELDTEKLSEFEMDMHIRHCKSRITELNAEIKIIELKGMAEAEAERLARHRANVRRYEGTINRLEKAKEEKPLSTDGIPPELFLKACKTILYPSVFNRIVKEAERLRS